MKYVVTVRGMLKGEAADMQQVHDAIIASSAELSKSMGNVAHHPVLNVKNNKEFFSMDEWDNMENIEKLYSDPNLQAEFAKLFEGQPKIDIWSDAGWKSY